MSRAEQINHLATVRALVANLDPDSVSCLNQIQIAASCTAIAQAEEQIRADGVELEKLRKAVRELKARAPKRKGTRVVSAKASANLEGIREAHRKFEQRIREGR